MLASLLLQTKLGTLATISCSVLVRAPPMTPKENARAPDTLCRHVDVTCFSWRGHALPTGSYCSASLVEMRALIDRFYGSAWLHVAPLLNMHPYLLAGGGSADWNCDMMISGLKQQGYRSWGWVRWWSIWWGKVSLNYESRFFSSAKSIKPMYVRHVHYINIWINWCWP